MKPYKESPHNQSLTRAPSRTQAVKLRRGAEAWISLGCLSALVFLFPACSPRHATPAEALLLPEARTEKYWLFNQILWDKDSSAQHYCTLITQSPSAQGNATSFFISHYRSRDSSFQYGLQVSSHGQRSKEGRWPFFVRIDGDSAKSNWRLFLDHQSLWLDGQFQGENTQAFSLRGTFPQQEAFAWNRALEAPAIRTFSPLHGALAEKKAAKMPAYFQGGVFAEAGSLLQDPAVQAIYWIQLLGHDGEASTMLLTQQKGAPFEVKSNFDFQNGQWKAASSGWDIYGDTTWVSPHCHKSYQPTLVFHGQHNAVKILPKQLDQEVRAGKRSFWMGAVDFVNADGSKLWATGNMYIFQK